MVILSKTFYLLINWLIYENLETRAWISGRDDEIFTQNLEIPPKGIGRAGDTHPVKSASLFWKFFLLQSSQRIWNFWKPGKIREFCATWIKSGKSRVISWNSEKSGNFNAELGKVREFYLRETNVAEDFSGLIQVVNKNASCLFICYAYSWISI